jgi:hypothetical protein
MNTVGILSGNVSLPPELRITDALVFGPAPDTQVLSEDGYWAPDGRGTELVDGTTRYYHDEDFTLDRDPVTGNIVSITTVANGALDAGGPADATFYSAEHTIDGDTVWYPTRSNQTRITVDATAAGPVTVNTQGRTSSSGAHNLGSSFVVAAGETRTRMIEEPVSEVRVQLTAVTGPVQVYVQQAFN